MRWVDEMLIIVKVLSSDAKVWPIEDWNSFARKTSQAYGASMLGKQVPVFYDDVSSDNPFIRSGTWCSWTKAMHEGPASPPVPSETFGSFSRPYPMTSTAIRSIDRPPLISGNIFPSRCNTNISRGQIFFSSWASAACFRSDWSRCYIVEVTMNISPRSCPNEILRSTTLHQSNVTAVAGSFFIRAAALLAQEAHFMQ